jgi:hypothetical protein
VSQHSIDVRGLLLATVVACAASAGAQAPVGTPSPQGAAAVTIERQEWRKDVDGPAPIRAIEVRNDHGDIRVRFNGERHLEALAVIQRLGPGPERVGFTVERRGEAVALVTGYAPGRVQDSDPDPPKAAFDRLDLTLFVPEGVALDARTLRGMVEARGLKSDVSARTSGGPAFVATSGTVRIRTDAGDITALLAPAAEGPPLLLESCTGAVAVHLPAQADLDVRAEGGAGAVSDFPLERHAAGQGARLEGRLGRGGRTLVVQSASGAVEIRRNPE